MKLNVSWEPALFIGNGNQAFKGQCFLLKCSLFVYYSFHVVISETALLKDTSFLKKKIHALKRCS